MNRNNTATLVGWHARKNTGDDAMLHVIAWFLSEYCGVNSIDLLVSHHNVPQARPEGVVYNPIYLSGNLFVRFFSRLLRKRSARSTRFLVFGGGSIFHSFNSIEWKNEMLSAARHNDPSHLVGALGVSLGPFKGDAAEKLCVEFIESLDFLVVRDRSSYEFASKCNLRAPVICTFDLALLLPYVTKTQKSHPTLIGGSLGLSLRPHPDGEVASKNLARTVARAINNIVKRNDIASLSLFSFCGDSDFGDDEIIDEVIRNLNREIPVKLVRYVSQPEEILREMGKCKVFIGMRLHSQIFAYMQSIPFVAIDYEHKCQGFLSEIKAQDFVRLPLNDLNQMKLETALDRVINSDRLWGVSNAKAVERTLTSLEILKKLNSVPK
jgi:polysaccharide pyruvyl transferase WcaK-like protein